MRNRCAISWPLASRMPIIATAAASGKSIGMGQATWPCDELVSKTATDALRAYSGGRKSGRAIGKAF